MHRLSLEKFQALRRRLSRDPSREHIFIVYPFLLGNKQVQTPFTLVAHSKEEAREMGFAQICADPQARREDWDLVIFYIAPAQILPQE